MFPSRHVNVARRNGPADMTGKNSNNSDRLIEKMKERLERAKGFEPSTSTLATRLADYARVRRGKVIYDIANGC
jgi:hypothetical protein